MNKKQIAFQGAQQRTNQCREWLKQFMRSGAERIHTKDELIEMAKEEMSLSRMNFDHAWVWAIEELGRQDWYEPIRNKRSKN